MTAEVRAKKSASPALQSKAGEVRSQGTEQNKHSVFRVLYSVLCSLFLLSACATTEPKKSSYEPEVQSPEKQQIHQPSSTERRTKNASQPVPAFVPVSEELSPLKTRIVSISARATAFRDVLYIVAESTGLNLAMEKGVDPDIPVTLTLNNVSAEDALNTIFSTVDYFYSIKDNILTVKAMDTRIFEFGQPSVIQDYSVDVGGDILGSATSGVASGGTTTTTTTPAATTTAGTTNIKGSVTQKIQADRDSFKLWDSIEKTLRNILGVERHTQAPQEAGVPAQPSQGIVTKSHVQPSFSVNRMTGTIIVTATKKDLQRVESYIKELKRVLNRQVVIEARIVEVQLSEGLKYGIDWSALNLSNLGQVTVGTTNFSNVVGSGSPAFQIGVSKWDFTGLLQAIQSQGSVRVLSNPRVNIMNGQTALLSVGRNESFISRVTTTITPSGTTNIITSSPETSSVLSGMIIGIVPFINEDGEISLTITPIVSDLVRLESKAFGQAGYQTEISLPTVDLRELSTTVKVKDGQMIVIGGLIQDKDSLKDSQVPLLGSIPIIGHLFKSRDKVHEKTELIIMLRPVLVTQ